MNMKINDFSKEYKSHTVTLQNINITGRISLIVGHNGSGKSTLLKAIAGLINYKGIIDCEYRVCYMDEFFSFPNDIKLYSFLILLNKTSIHPVSVREVKEMIKYFKLTEKLDVELKNLSKGMKAKVNIIQCLLEKADIYLLDEPLSGLDKEGIILLKKYLQKSKYQYVISTHLDAEFKEISDEVIMI